MTFLPQPAKRIADYLAGRRRWVVLAMLVALHAALASDPGSALQRIGLLVHFGLFLLWQPFFATERELEILSGALLVVLVAATLYFLAGWMIVTWLLLLLGILGGRVFTTQAAKLNRFYLLAFAYVLSVQLLWAVPELLVAEAGSETLSRIARVGVPWILVLLAVMPAPAQEEGSVPVFDFFYAVLVFQLGLVLVLGSLALMRMTGGNYFAAVAFTVLGFGVALFLLAILWNPLRGFGGLRTYFSRYLLSVGMPFELWVRRIAELAESEPDSRRFLEEALAEVARLPWMRGARWRSPDGEGAFGADQGYPSSFSHHGLEVVFYTEIRLSPALFLHMRLLAHVVGEFYEGKRREIALRRHAYLEAVHETGARLTHDVKNLLQSLYALTSADLREPSDRYEQLLRRQLPQLTKRLNATLEKLRSPERAAAELPVMATTWWAEVRRRLAGTEVEVSERIAADAAVPASLLDSFLENALENARAKARREPGVAIRVALDVDGDRVALSVCDTGSAVPAGVAAHLFHEPIERARGLGIGLYHAARQAERSGFRLVLASNRDGDVRFVLESAARGEADPQAASAAAER